MWSVPGRMAVGGSSNAGDPGSGGAQGSAIRGSAKGEEEEEEEEEAGRGEERGQAVGR